MVKAVFPGTFDPIHYGHIDIAARAARLFDEVIVAVYDRPLKTLLFSPEERLGLVRKTFKNHSNIKVTGYNILTVEFCRKIRETDNKTFIIALTGHTALYDIDRLKEVGFDNHLTKPFKIEIISQAIKEGFEEFERRA